jgi:hypothetical protein
VESEFNVETAGAGTERAGHPSIHVVSVSQGLMLPAIFNHDTW